MADIKDPKYFSGKMRISDYLKLKKEMYASYKFMYTKYMNMLQLDEKRRGKKKKTMIKYRSKATSMMKSSGKSDTDKMANMFLLASFLNMRDYRPFSMGILVKACAIKRPVFSYNLLLRKISITIKERRKVINVISRMCKDGLIAYSHSISNVKYYYVTVDGKAEHKRIMEEAKRYNITFGLTRLGKKIN